jgi:hypothetical protein
MVIVSKSPNKGLSQVVMAAIEAAVLPIRAADARRQDGKAGSEPGHDGLG